MSGEDDWIKQELQRQRQQGAGQAIVATRAVQPDTAARANVLARRLGLPPETVERNLADIDAFARARDTAATVRSAPAYVQQWFSDPRNAAAGHDDAATLKRLADNQAYWKRALANQGTISAVRPPKATLGNYLWGLWETTKNTFGHGGLLDSSMSMIANDWLPKMSFIKDSIGPNGMPAPSSAATDAFRQKMHMRDFEAAQSRINAATPDFESRTAGAVYSGVNSFIQQSPGLIASALTGNPAPALAYGGSMQGVQSYGKYRSRGGTANEAAVGGLAEGAVEVATELLPTHYLTGAFGSKTAKGFIGQVGKSILADVPGEQIATFTQDAIDTAIANPDASWSKFWADRPGAAYDTLIATLTQGAMTAGIGSVGHYAARRMETQGNAAVLDGIMEDAGQSKLRARDPEAFSKFIAGLSQDTPIENVYIPGEAIRELMQDSYRDDAFWGGYADQIDEAAALGGDVVIPLADVATHLAGSDQWNALRGEARFSPGGMSEAELASLEEHYRAGLDQMQGQMAEAAQAAMEAAAPAMQVYSEIRQQLQDAGFAADAADHYAQAWTANREAWASRLGTDALTYHQQNPVKFQRILPEKLAKVQAVDGLDLVINAMQKGKEHKANQGPSLLEWIAARGGIEDKGGNIASMGGDKWHREKAFRKRLLKPFVDGQGNMLGSSGPNENSLERTFEAAISEGFFPHLLHTTSSNIVGGVDASTYADKADLNDFLDAIGQELRGSPVYAENQAKNEADLQMQDAADELASILSGMGIDPQTASKADIKNAMKAYSAEQADGRALEQRLPDTIDIDGKPRPTRNSNGDQLAATEEGVRNFWKWFGDSKIVDAEGRPLVVYHGTGAEVGSDFAFNLNHLGKNGRTEGAGFYFTTDRRVAEGYSSGGSIIEAYIHGESPLALNAPPFDRETTKKLIEGVVEAEADALDMGIGDGYLSNWGDVQSDGYARVLKEAVDAAMTNETAVDQFNELIGSGVDAHIVNRVTEEVTGHDVIVADGFENLQKDGQTIYIVLNPENVKSVENTGAFDPTNPRIMSQGSRGRVSGGLISGDGGPSVIDLFEKADLSTIIHETGHIWLEELKRNAMLPDAPEDVRADWETVKSWFAENGHAIGEDGFIPTDAHELWARGIERHALEGKSPSNALSRVFNAFRAWLLTIYKHVANLNAPITPEVRRVMDRLYATQEAIDNEAERQNVKALFTDAAQAGMTEAEFAAYQQAALDARSEAYDALLYRTMATIRRERTKLWRDQERAVKDDVTGRINKRPDFRALHLLRTGRWLGDPEREPVKVKLDRAWLAETYGTDALALLPKGVPPIYGDNGDNADLIANMVGFRSGDEMVRALMGIEAAQQEMRAAGDKRNVRQRAIDEETAAIMAERHGDPLNDGSIEEEAMAAINNDRQTEIIASEARALGRQRGMAPTPMRLAREWAARKIAEGKVIDVASRAALQRYAKAAAKASRSAEAALVEGDVDEAFRQKQAQLLNVALLAEAKKAADAVDAAVDRLSKIARRRTMKSVDQEYLDRAHALLEKFDMRPRSQRAVDEQQSFMSWAAEQQAKGVDVVIPPRLEDQGIHYTRMTVEELKGLDESVKQIVHLGRYKQKLLDAQEEREFNEVVGDALASVEQLRPIDPTNRMAANMADTVKGNLASADAALLKMETVFDWLDDGNPNGVFNRVVFRRIADAQTRERDMMQDYVGRIQGLLADLPPETIKRWQEHVGLPELLNRETGQPWDMTRDQLIAIALNVGNEGNFDKLARGYGWSQEGIMRVLNRELNAEEWKFVQSIWDTIDGLWPEIEALEKRLNGVAPEKIEPRSITLDDGTVLRGGYYPVVYDSTKDATAEAQAAAAGDALFENIYTRATTPRGFTKERTNVARPVLLSLGVVNRHVAEVIHDVTHREAVIDADRFLSDRRIVAAVRRTLGPAVQKQFRPWLQHIANEWAIDRKGVEGWDKLARTLRTHSTIVGMGYRLTTILAQIGGYANSAEQIGAKWLASGFRASWGTPAKMVESFNFVMERSGEMRHRMETLERDINANIRELQGRRGMLANVRRFAFHGIGYMDRVVVVPTWLGAFNKAQSEGMSEEDAVYYADKVVRNSQGAGAAKDLASVQRGSEWMKLATMFYSYASTFYNRQRSLARDANEAIASRRTSDLPALVARSWWLFAVAPILGTLPSAMLGGGGPDDDESWAGWAFRAMLLGQLQGLPIFRDVGNAVVNGFDYAFTPAGRLFDTVIKSTRDLKALLDMDPATEPSNRAVKNAVESVGYTAGLPTGQISNASQFIVDWANGEARPETVGDWLIGLQTGKVPHEGGSK